jgi:large subunit ribosomal protein L24
MKVKVGDKVRVLAGKDKGKEGTITSILKKKDRVVVSGVNVVKKHIKPSAYNENGGIVEVEASIHVSNVKVVESKDSKKAAKTAKVTEKATKEEATTKKAAAKKTTKKVGDK